MTNLDSVLKKQRHQFVDKGPYSQSYGFSSSHTQMWKVGHKEGWALYNWCFQNVVLEKILESPLDSKQSNQSIKLFLMFKLSIYLNVLSLQGQKSYWTRAQSKGLT